MKIIDCKDIDCKFLEEQFKLFDYQGLGKNQILVYNKKLLIKKSKNTNEINKIKKIINLVVNYQSKIFIASHYKTYIYNDYYYIFMKKYEDTIKYIKYQNIEEFKNIVQQGLLFSLFLNYELKTFHNDMHLNNCLYKNIEEPITLKFKGIELKITNRLIKLIDFENISNKYEMMNLIKFAKLNNKKYKELIYNDFTSFLIQCMIFFRIKNNKIIRQSNKAINLLKIVYYKLSNIIKNLNIQNNLDDQIKFYKYINLNFNQVFAL